MTDRGKDTETQEESIQRVIAFAEGVFEGGVCINAPQYPLNEVLADPRVMSAYLATKAV